jgi:undecaprenyl-diphosphatase
MDYLSVLLAGFFQGLFEWLPISSSGQTMVYLINLVGLSPDAAFSLGIYLHLGTCAAVLVKYQRQWLGLLEDKILLRFLIVSSAATGASGLGLYYLLKTSLAGFDGAHVNALVGATLIVTGLVLYFSGKKNYGRRKLKDMSLSEQAIVGLAQGFSILPGISRSGVTVAALATSDIEKTEVWRLSFLMSVPAVLGAVFLEIYSDGIPDTNIMGAFLGIGVSFITGYLLMEAVLKATKTVKFYLFCIGFGLLAVASSLFTFI